MILPLAGDVLGGVAHVVAVEGLPQPVLDHGVDEFEAAHLLAGTQIGAVRRHAHGLLAARDDDVGVAFADRLQAERDGAQARAAQLVDAPGWRFDGDSGRDRGLAGRVLALAGGEDLAHDHFGDARRVDGGAIDGGHDGHLAEFVGGQAAEGTVEGADGRAGGRQNDHIVLHGVLLFVGPATRDRTAP